MQPLPNADEPHRVPSGYWKVVGDADGEYAAFIFDQETERGAEYCAYQVSLEEVERRTGLDLSPSVPNSLMSESLSDEIGC